MTALTAVCRTCNTTFTKNPGLGLKRRYCGTRCQSRAAGRRHLGLPEHDQPYTTTCLNCRAPIIGRNHGARYCTKSCSNAAYARRAATRRQATS